MTSHYTRHGFIRQAGNGLLAKYLADRGIDSGIDIAKHKARDTEPIIQAIDRLPADQLSILDRDFPRIDALANKAGAKEIRNQAAFLGLDLNEGLGTQTSRLNAAFWTFLNHPSVFDGAEQFAMPRLSGRYWKRALAVVSAPGIDLTDKTETLNGALRRYFGSEEGRGKSCKIDYVRRAPLHLLYCYPEDFPDAPLAWDRDRLEAHPYRPAFEVVFVYDEVDGTVDVYFNGGTQGIKRLHRLFAETVFDLQEMPVPAAAAYQLDGLQGPAFAFAWPVDGPVRDVRVKRLVFATRAGRPTVVSIETDVSRDPSALKDEIDRVFVRGSHSSGRLSLSEMKVIGARVQATIDMGDGKRPRTRTFELIEKSCSLAHDEIGQALRQVLVASGIDLTARGKGGERAGPAAELAAE